ncbi:hypothetical protein Tco_0708237 [Tanacetum coccineum]
MVTHWFTLTVLSALRRSDNENMLSRSSQIRSIKVKEFQRSFRHSDTERLSRSDEVLKLKNFKKDATLKLFKSTNREIYGHVGPKVTRYTRWQSLQDGKKRLCLVDGLKMLKITFSHISQNKGTSLSLKSMITTSIHKLMIEVKDYELKTNGKA